MATIGEQVQQNDAVQVLTEILTQAGCSREDAEKAAPSLIDGVKENT